MESTDLPPFAGLGGRSRVCFAAGLIALGVFALSPYVIGPARADTARRKLIVQNHTSEPVRVFVAYHSITTSGRWGWFNTDDTTSWVLQPGQRSALNDRGFVVNADMVRVRARGERSGRTWDWGESFIGEAARGASKVIGQTLLTVWAEDGLALFSDRHTRRQLQIANATGEALHVCIAYHTRDASGSWGWRNADCRRNWLYAPGELSFAASGPQRITANAVKISAMNTSGSRVWAEHRDEALFIGDYEGSGGVKGSYKYTFSKDKGRPFQPLALREVKVHPAKTMVGRSVEVTISYTVDGIVPEVELGVLEEQLIERQGKGIKRFITAVRRKPGTYRSKRKITIPVMAEAGEYAIVGTVGLGRKVRSYMGVNIQTLGLKAGERLGLDGAKGALVTAVKPGGPAHKAGIQTDDVITRFNGRKVASAKDLMRFTGESPPGTAVALAVLRGNEEQEVSLTLKEPPGGVIEGLRMSKRVALQVTAP